LRNVMLVRHGALTALHEAIVAERIAGTNYGPPAKPH
jgi:hypothetical protein